MALFCRVSGGIFNKSVDVGADLIGKVENDLKEESARNPVTIANYVGDNVGKVVGVGSDLFSSCAESTCAALILIVATEPLIFINGKINSNILAYPFLIQAAGLGGSLLTSFFGSFILKVTTIRRISGALNLQMLLSILFTLAISVAPVYMLPTEWKIPSNILEPNGETKTVNRWYAFIATALGNVSSLLIAGSINYSISYFFPPVKEMAVACTSGPAINIIYGLALGYKSTIVPVIFLAVTILASINLLGLLGVALSAIAMLSTISIDIAVDTFGPIVENANGIAYMSRLDYAVTDLTEALNDAGSNSASVGKGYTVGSNALVGLCIYAAFITVSSHNEEHRIEEINLTDPWIFGSLLVGAMLPFALSALTMKSVGVASQDMVDSVRKHFKNSNDIKDEDGAYYRNCIILSTRQSLKEMILPSLLVLITPLFVGIVFHPVLLAGLIPGALLSGVQLAFSMTNSGSAWKSCKTFIGGENYKNSEGVSKTKGSEEYEAAVIGDVVGDPLKGTSGPALSVMVKLMAVVSMVFIGGFAQTSWLAKPLKIEV